MGGGWGTWFKHHHLDQSSSYQSKRGRVGACFPCPVGELGWYFTTSAHCPPWVAPISQPISDCVAGELNRGRKLDACERRVGTSRCGTAYKKAGEKRRAAPKEKIVAQGLHPNPGPAVFHTMDDSEGSAWEEESQRSAEMPYDHEEEALPRLEGGEEEQDEPESTVETFLPWHSPHLQQYQAFWPLNAQGIPYDPRRTYEDSVGEEEDLTGL